MSSARLWNIVSDNYGTYRDEQTQAAERHGFRLAVQALASVILSLFVDGLSDDNISVLVTALSILIGFAFAAMFPIALESVGGLPKPLYAEDRDDIRVIRQLAMYFRFNVAYFIPLALTCVATLLIQMLDLTVPNFISGLQPRLSPLTADVWYYVSHLRSLASKALLSLSIMLLQESCYTFYRMCFNALSLLRIKEEYISSRSE
ncbi:hypothetical protein LQ954_09485 [Sphingomonas sp. IC-11]|uniref:hypothetical protein n=1 Tax=Sphingomonas sp. IC-11 TaxID=2898528 RepID=UPI001E443E8F|nr:hypothetical protein [Sphingomonas sp. IC-11]MCD2316380.1 hypothetical protein [Sphingomonas sp. IC-11]